MNININDIGDKLEKNIISIPREIVKILEQYITEFRELHFKDVSEFILFLIREKIREIINKN
ncbi:MAG: hypothetical protein ACP6IY_21445 [Promethearchaeia archaeon]